MQGSLVLRGSYENRLDSFQQQGVHLLSAAPLRFVPAHVELIVGRLTGADHLFLLPLSCK